jgi:hypothetical protein
MTHNYSSRRQSSYIISLPVMFLLLVTPMLCQSGTPLVNKTLYLCVLSDVPSSIRFVPHKKIEEDWTDCQ